MSDIQAMQFGRYELLERLGAGGMAEVYRARYTAAPGVTRPVVIKRVMSHCAHDPAFVEMFLNEARISVGLSHGNIVQVFDFGQVDGEYFLAMELVDGQSLSALLRKARAEGIALLPAPIAVGIVIELCRGLHYAHTRVDETGAPLGLVHRDISPDNVLLSYEGEVKLADFGIAKARLAGRVETEAGVLKGKYLYFSPEQAKGEPLDARSDVYAVGVVLYQMLCGRRPAEGEELEVMRRIVEGQLTPARQLNPLLDEGLREILRKALATSREERYPTAEALHLALSGWMGTQAPLFPAHMRKHLLGWLFREQLTAERRPPVLPPEFSRWVQRWQAELSPPPETVPWEVAAVSLDLPPSAPRRVTPWPVEAAPEPVLRDTVPAHVRPRGWSTYFGERFMQGAALGAVCLFLGMAWLALRDSPGPPRRAAPSGVPVPTDTPSGPMLLATLADAPVDAAALPARVVLQGTRHSFLPIRNVPWVPLDDSRSYAIWTEGKYQPARPRAPKGTRAPVPDSERLLVVVAAGSQMRLQTVSSSAQTLEGAYALQAFVLRASDWPQRGSGIVGLNLRDTKESRLLKERVQVPRDSIELAPPNSFIVKGLEPSRSYTVEISPRERAPQGQVVLLIVSEERPVLLNDGRFDVDWLHVLDVGRYQVSGAQELRFTLPNPPGRLATEMEVRVEVLED